MSLRSWLCARASRLVAGGAWLAAAVSVPVLLGAQAPAQPPAPQRPGAMPTLPLTQLDDSRFAADFDNRTFTLTFAQPVPIKDLLLLLVRGTNLSIVPDPALSGSFIGELKNVTVRQALELILKPLGLDFAADGGFIRVFARQPETRLFDINYVATARVGEARIGATAQGEAGSFAHVSSTTAADVFAELTKGVQTLLSDRGAFNVDRKAGLLQMTDYPERLDRVAVYLDAVQDRVHRQVQIDARVLEVELNEANAQGLDWAALSRPAAAAPAPATPVPSRSLTGLRVADLPAFMAALSAQGKVSVLASPRLLAMNNEPAIIRAVTDRRPAARREDRTTDAVTLSVTPQIGLDGIVMLSLSPMVTFDSREPDDGGAAATTSVREADVLARVRDGETVVISGIGRDRAVRERRSVGLAGGWFGRSTVVTKKRVELVILVTPRILAGAPLTQ